MRLGKLRYESKYLAIRHFHETKGWGIGWMCRQLEVSRAAYYKWTHREIPVQEQENIKLAGLIREYDERFRHILGYRRMTSWINHFNHTTYSKNRVHRIMKKLRIHSVIRKKKKKYSPYAPQTMAENKLSRDFYAAVPDQKWSTDVTEFKIPGGKGKLYLSMILDLYDRYPVSYVISSRNDNGPAEGLWGIIKSEMYQMYEITDEASLKHAIRDYMRFYSEERPQDRYHCKTPLEVRNEALASDHPIEYPIPPNKRIEKYKEKWCA